MRIGEACKRLGCTHKMYCFGGRGEQDPSLSYPLCKDVVEKIAESYGYELVRIKEKENERVA